MIDMRRSEFAPAEVVPVAVSVTTARLSAPVNRAVGDALALSGLRDRAQFGACFRRVRQVHSGCAVKRSVARDVDEFQVLKPVVISDAVAVVDLILGRDGAVRNRPDVAVLQPALAVDADLDVAVRAPVPAPAWRVRAYQWVAVSAPVIPMGVAVASSVDGPFAAFNRACFHTAQFNN